MDTKIYYNSTKYIQKDKKKRFLYLKTELERNILLSVAKDQHTSFSTRLSATMQLEQLTGPQSLIKNRCILSGRGRSVLRLYKVSRLFFRKLAANGYLPGINKASW